MYKISSVADIAALYTPLSGLAEGLEAMVGRVIVPGCKVEAGVGVDRICGRVTQVYRHVALVEWTDENGNLRKETVRLHDFLTRYARVKEPALIAQAVRRIGASQQFEIAESRKQTALVAVQSLAV